MGKENGLEIKAVETDKLRSGIPLADWGSVKNTLTLLGYASGRRNYRTGGGHDNESPITPEEFQYTARTSPTHVNQNGGYEVMIPDEMEIAPLIEELIAEARGMVEENAGQIWTTAGGNPHISSKIALGSLYGKTVTVRKIKPAALLLGLSSPHADWNDEEELAKSLGIEQALYQTGIMLRLKPTANRFVIDFDRVAELVNPILDSNPVVGRDFVKDLYTNSTQPGGHWDQSAPLWYQDGLELRAGIVGGGNPRSWEVEGATLSGPFESYTSILDGLLKPTTLRFSIQKTTGGLYTGAMPVADLSTKTTIFGLTDKVAKVFRNR